MGYMDKVFSHKYNRTVELYTGRILDGVGEMTNTIAVD
jgi:hypothetical protein